MVDAGPAGEFNERRERFSRSAFLLLLKEVSMEVLAQALNKTIDTYCELKAGDSVIAAISGGADSMALLDSLRYVAGQRGLVLFAVHVQHHLRGAEAEADAETEADAEAVDDEVPRVPVRGRESEAVRVRESEAVRERLL